MERVSVNAYRREATGKGVARSLRRKGELPAVIYRAGTSEPIRIPKAEFIKIIRQTKGENVLVNLQFPEGNRLAIIKDYQLDPITGELLHTDFQEVLLTETVRLTVKVITKGVPKGVKDQGGILQHTLRELEIEALPDRIPGHIEVDVSGLGVGQSIHVSDLKLEEGIKILTDPEEVIVTVTAPAVEEAAPAAPEITEPEVIKKGKKEEAEEKEEGKK
ncbi:MAG: 50S ribosomal protein L25 [Thermodesulfovibrionales bacterium]|nr:50S ribosomal protein L25 [Thermodesulfovibrionales bacterium]